MPMEVTIEDEGAALETSEELLAGSELEEAALELELLIATTTRDEEALLEEELLGEELLLAGGVGGTLEEELDVELDVELDDTGSAFHTA